MDVGVMSSNIITRCHDQTTTSMLLACVACDIELIA
jgi:hypothetical protein